jgi:hypothetical protein
VAQESGREVWNDFLKDELASEEARRDSLEQRGTSVITVSGALVTLLFGLSALATKAEPTYRLTSEARTYLYVALALFVGSALLAIATNVPLLYGAVDESNARKIIDKYLENSVADAQTRIAATRANLLPSNRKRNGLKAAFLLGAVAAQALAVLFVGLAIFEVLKAAPVK